MDFDSLIPFMVILDLNSVILDTGQKLQSLQTIERVSRWLRHKIMCLVLASV